jgi:hypothetical protein
MFSILEAADLNELIHTRRLIVLILSLQHGFPGLTYTCAQVSRLANPATLVYYDRKWFTAAEAISIFFQFLPHHPPKFDFEIG